MSHVTSAPETSTSQQVLPKKRSRFPLASQVFLALILGGIFGYFFPQQGAALKPVGDVFLRMIKMLIVPLVFATLIVGIAGTGSFKQVGRLGLKAMAWFWGATTVAMAYGLFIANVLRPGAGVPIMHTQAHEAIATGKPITVVDLLMRTVPANPFEAATTANLLQIVFFSCFFGVAVAAMGDRGKIIVDFFEAIKGAMFHVTRYVIKLTPYGVFAFASFTVGKFGLALIMPLAKLIGCLYLGLILFVISVLCVACAIIRVNFFFLLRIFREALVITFTTASSEAAMPMTMERLEKFGVPKHIVGFVLPTGYSFNMDGGSLYHIMAVMFIAQVYGIHLTIGQQIVMFLTMAVAQKGAAGVAGIAIVIISAVLPTFGLPMEGLFMILGVDRIMDMGRSAVNLIGNIIATLIVARWENELPHSTVQAAYELEWD
ncbi:MAG: cation:dicarboxylase symporter family transporter [Candidatus Korobacteraceae bacterium]|jgi:proton glutamate symport protein